jgi:ketosteroid isomerase-like protein
MRTDVWCAAFSQASLERGTNSVKEIRRTSIQGENNLTTATVRTQPPKDETEILTLLNSLAKAHYAKNAAAIAAPFASDAAVYDLSPPLAHHGIDIREKQAWLDTWDGPIEIESRDFKFTVSGDYAFGYGYYRMSGNPKAAGRHISFWMRATVCLERNAGGWKIVHEHTSVPFYMDGSLRPAFDLEP